MGKKFKEYNLEDFLDNPDFCSWARSERPELNNVYNNLLKKYPEQKKVFHEAYKIVRLLDDEKQKPSLNRKLQIWEEINRIYRQQYTSKKNYKIYFRYAASVALLLAIGSLFYYFISTNTERNFISSYNRQDFTETKLLMDNGREINVATDKSEIVYDLKGEEIKINNQVVQKKEELYKSEMNQLIVPFGKQSKIILSDHTEVWLNAGSRLIYPTVFEDSKRKVKLQGEAFFKVSKDKLKPFIVETNNSNIKVLGTSFNVKAYPDEKTEETVLVEGSVCINLGKTILGKEILLEPEQRMIVADTDRSYSVISKVRVKDYTSWIEGLFIFKDEPLSAALMRISRFYNLEIHWMNDAESRKISGKLDLKEDYQRVLGTLALISDANYIEKEGKIYFKLNKKKEE